MRHEPVALASGLKLPPSAVADALRADARAATAPTMPALQRYTGVLFQSLSPATLSAAAVARAEEQVIVVSGLWGPVRAGDLVPDYRVPAAGNVPGLGGVTAHWRGPLAEEMADTVGDHAILDLRSTDYRGMWTPRDAERVVTVRVVAERAPARRGAAGVRSQVSFQAKTVKGLVLRHLVSASTRQEDPMMALARAADAMDMWLEPDQMRASRPGAPRSVDVVGRYP